MAAVVVLGAGASYGSHPDKTIVPPLGKDLFRGLEERGGIAATLPDHLKQKFSPDFEKGMAAYLEFAGGDVMIFQRESAAYLAGFRPTSDNVYRRLIRVLPKRRVIYASLNYDLLLELSIQSLGLKYKYDLTHEFDHVRCLKIYGSVDFWPQMNHNSIIGGYFGGLGIDIQADVEILSHEHILQKLGDGQSVSPAIAIFSEGKIVKTCPDFVKKQQELWRSALRSATVLIVIGVRVHPVDAHVWEQLAASSAPIVYFGSKDDETEFQNWVDHSKRRSAEFHACLFENSIDKIDNIIHFGAKGAVQF